MSLQDHLKLLNRHAHGVHGVSTSGFVMSDMSEDTSMKLTSERKDVYFGAINNHIIYKVKKFRNLLAFLHFIIMVWDIASLFQPMG
jgi:hypothetical protein